MKITNKAIIQTILLVSICTMRCYAQSHYIEKKKSEVLIYADNFPTFKGGGNGIHTFLKKLLKWPVTELDVQGTVLASFTVLKSEVIENIKIEKSLSKDFDEEVIRVISIMPKWRPGTFDGKIVNVKVYFPINFFLKT